MSLSTTYLLYLAISAAVTVWVARMLHRWGRVFLVVNFHGNERLADAVNDLLVVGFYLLNLGYVALALRYGAKPASFSESLEFLAAKVGLVLLLLGVIHCFNLIVLAQMGRKRNAIPPVRKNAGPKNVGFRPH